MPAKHVLSLAEMGAETIARLVARANDFAAGRVQSGELLKNKIVGIYFRKSSTRTRTSFSVGAMKLGASVIAYGPSDLQITTGETLEDTARVLAGYLDILVIRTNESQEEMEVLASQDEMSVINAMSASEHPTQAIADLSTLREAFGRLDGLHVLYLGEGNNTAVALAYGVTLTPGMQLTVVTPEGNGLPEDVLERARRFGAEHGARIEHHHRADRLPKNVDAVYATRWQTMGVPKPDPNWLQAYAPYSVTTQMMAAVSKPSGTVFLHDLPAVRGEDVHSEVLDGPQSQAWRQARHKLFGAMAILEWCVCDT